ncbi:flotillin family protein [Undibacterium sp.]|uniref:flotillin family protein n=1 Tax=Undibacterium sp. TaxID=1914977 RepID=UPI003752F60F
MNSLIEIGILSGAGLFGLIIIGMIFARLYKRASKEVAFVRTGLGGQKVILDGGAIVLPVFHEIILVNMNTLKLEVSKRDTESLTTKDRMRVNVVAGFFVRVKQSAESISTAAQTLGQRTLDPEALKELVEDKFVDALRATAVSMTMQGLQDQRRDFVQAVQNAVAEDLEKNGLELESVSLTALDQTDKKFFNPDNAFDAEGLTRLTEETQARRKQRNDIEQVTEVQVQTKNLEAKRMILDIARDEEFASLEQQRAIANSKAEQSALIAQTEAQRTREGQEAFIASEQAVKEKSIAAERAVREAEIEKNLAINIREIEAKRKTEVQSAEQRKQIEIANQDAQIAIANKSKEQSEADATANLALSEAVKSEELVKTSREVAAAEREKSIQLIDASKVAEREAIGITVAAAADKDAALNRAEAIRVEAEANKDAALAEAAGKLAINDAMNKLSAEQIGLTLRMEMLRMLPAILEKATKPMEKIDSIKLFQVNGMPGSNGHSDDGTHSNGCSANGSLPDQVVNAALNYQIAQPLVNAIMSDAGLGNGSLSGIVQKLSDIGLPAVTQNQ